MLVLTRRVGERILIGDQIEVTVVRIGSGSVRIGVNAPIEMTVTRREIRIGRELVERGRRMMQPK